MTGALPKEQLQFVLDHLNSQPAVNRVKKERFAPKDKINWRRLGFIMRPDYKSPPVSDMKEARNRLRCFLDQRMQRYGALENFLGDNSVTLEQTDEGVNAVNAFYARNVYSNEEGTDIHPIWISFIWNYGLFLGDMAIKQAEDIRKLRWVVENIAIAKLGEQMRTVFKVGGYRYNLSNWSPTESIIQTGRWMLKAKETDITAGGRFPDPNFNFLLELARSQESAVE